MDDARAVFELLYDRVDGYFLAGELASEANLSLTRLDKAIESLRQNGQGVEFSPAHGYRLARPVKLFPSFIERGLNTKRIGRNVICFDEVDSTNDVALDSARQCDTDGLVICAEFQRKGRGRHGRVWLSQPFSNLLFSVLVLDETSNLSHEALTIATGLAVAEGIESSCPLACELKWPNDVLIDGKKVSGVIVELQDSSRGGAVVLGVGINVNDSPPPDKTDLPSANLAGQLGHHVERVEVLKAVLKKLDERLAGVERNDIDELHNSWVSRCGMINQRVTVMCAGIRHVGRIIDVSPLEGLILCEDSGRTVHLPAGNSTLLV